MKKFSHTDVPLPSTLYPAFHPNRSRFFNMAFLYNGVLSALIHGLEKEFSYENLAVFLPFLDMGDRSYVKWEGNGGVDLQLPGFKLTNRQMYWVCLVHITATKYHRNLKTRYEVKEKKVNANLHTFLIKSLKEAFQCTNSTSR